MAEKKNTTTFTVKDGKKKLSCVIKEPDFEAVAFGLASCALPSGESSMAKGGKAIFDTCQVSCDPAIEADGAIMAWLCIRIAEEFLMPVEIEIKKN